MAELRRIGLAEDDTARALQALDDDGVLLRDMVRKKASPEGARLVKPFNARKKVLLKKLTEHRIVPQKTLPQ